MAKVFKEVDAERRFAGKPFQTTGPATAHLHVRVEHGPTVLETTRDAEESRGIGYCSDVTLPLRLCTPKSQHKMLLIAYEVNCRVITSAEEVV